MDLVPKIPPRLFPSAVAFLAAIIVPLSVFASGAEKILILGDSITAGYNLPEADAYPSILEEKLHRKGLRHEVINAGKSGDTTAGGLRRIKWLLSRETPDIVVIALGANDGLRGLPVETMRRNLEAIAEVIREKAPGARILLSGMRMPDSMGADYTETYFKAFRKVAEKKDLRYLPFLLEGVGGNPDLNQDDGIHPNAEGQKRIAENVWEALRPLLSEDHRETPAKATE